MIQVREAIEEDVEAIRDVFFSCYGETYTYPQYYDLLSLKKMVFESDTLLLVAEDSETGRVCGTASVILDLGAHGDLLGEFGRLAVHPDARRRGIGHLLMDERLDRVKDRLHIVIIENRVVHPYSQAISACHGFTAAGFCPMKMQFDDRESQAVYIRHFGDSLALRKNHPRIIPEAFALGEHVLDGCGCTNDVIADEDTPAYAFEGGYELKKLTTGGYASLLRLERGRVRHREIFGPVRLHTGLFQIRVSHAQYLLACRDDAVCGGVGFTVDEVERAVKIFELVSVDHHPIRFLLTALEEQCRANGDIDYIEVDVNAHFPAMQRTLLEVGFLPIGYIPAMVFHRVERLDAVRMARVLVPVDVENVQLHATMRPIAEPIFRAFGSREALPHVLATAVHSRFFADLNTEQIQTVSSISQPVSFAAGEPVFQQTEPADTLYLVVEGNVNVVKGAEKHLLREIAPGDTIGERAILTDSPRYSMGAIASCDATLIAFPVDALKTVLQLRPDIGSVLYRNLAALLGEKLKQADKHTKHRQKEEPPKADDP